MLRNKRVGKTKRRATIRFSNPYRTTGVRQRANRIMTGPLIREGITSVENHEKEAAQRRYSQLANAGMLKQMKELGIIPDHVGVDMNEFVGNNISLPNGVTSVEEAENQRDIARQIEQFNAGIMDEATHEQKVLTELAQKRKKDEYRTKLIQWLAETDELDEIPNEFREEVEAYYAKKDKEEHKNVGTTLSEMKAKREKRKKEQEEKEKKKRFERGYWEHTDPFANIAMPIGNGEIHGWRAPRLHRLLRPIKPFIIEHTPEQLVEEQKDDLEKRRDEYKNEQMQQRGLAPPKDMIERAFPKTAEPMLHPFRKFQDINVVPHPFVFPKKKYWVVNGV